MSNKELKKCHGHVAKKFVYNIIYSHLSVTNNLKMY
jgi:hypothetical protein